MKRVVVFIDAQNFYRSARRAFAGAADPHFTMGQFLPWALGGILAARDPGRELAGVRLYTGQPDAFLQPRAHSANARQRHSWEAAGCTVFSRPLRFPPSWTPGHSARPEEKGIDVAMALDIVRMADAGQYDTGIVCTGDTDLIPAIELVLDSPGDVAVEVAPWRGTTHRQA